MTLAWEHETVLAHRPNQLANSESVSRANVRKKCQYRINYYLLEFEVLVRKGTNMNIWIIGGFGGIGLLVFFLTQPVFQGGASNLSILTGCPECTQQSGIAGVTGILVVLIIAAFVMAYKESNKA